MLSDTERAALVDILNRTITVAHGEGEALGTSRHKDTQCDECAKREEQHYLQTYGRNTPWPKKEQHVPPPVGLSLADRRELAESVVGDIERVLVERDLDALLDGLPDGWRLEHFPYYRMDDGYYHCKITVPFKSRAIHGAHRPYYGTGPTRTAAVQAAVQAAGLAGEEQEDE